MNGFLQYILSRSRLWQGRGCCWIKGQKLLSRVTVHNNLKNKLNLAVKWELFPLSLYSTILPRTKFTVKKPCLDPMGGGGVIIKF